MLYILLVEKMGDTSLGSLKLPPFHAILGDGRVPVGVSIASIWTVENSSIYMGGLGYLLLE
jgi:hypothetical protein